MPERPGPDEAQQASIESRLSELEPQLDAEIDKLRAVVSKKRQDGEHIEPEDFDLRSKLYAFASEIAPTARRQDLEQVKARLRPQPGEVGIDVAAGTGFLDRMLVEQTQSKVYAVDPSGEQLEALKRRTKDLPVVPIEGTLSDAETFQMIGEDIGRINYVTSFGGIHHIIDHSGEKNQRSMFENAARALRPGGRFVGADVGANTKLSEHFDRLVTPHSLTGHEGNWLSEERLKEELLPGTGLELISTELVPIQWEFENKKQMAMFMKSLHAYDLTQENVLLDLRNVLGYEERDGRCYLNWPMFFFHLEKQEPKA